MYFFFETSLLDWFQQICAYFQRYFKREQVKMRREVDELSARISDALQQLHFEKMRSEAKERKEKDADNATTTSRARSENSLDQIDGKRQRLSNSHEGMLDAETTASHITTERRSTPSERMQFDDEETQSARDMFTRRELIMLYPQNKITSLLDAPPQDEQLRRAHAYDYRQRYCGHCNTTTDIKQARYIGP